MSLTRIVPPEGSPVTLEEVKDCFKIEHTDDDEELQRLINEETEHLEGWWGKLNKALRPQTWLLQLDEFPAGAIKIPVGPLIEVTSIKIDDEDGNEQTVPTGDYVVDTTTDHGWIVPVADTDWPATLERVNAVRIEFVAGYPDEPAPTGGSGAIISTVPEVIKAAIRLRVGERYEKRENYAEAETKTAADRLVGGYKPLIIA